jgi:hypothetical protein
MGLKIVKGKQRPPLRVVMYGVEGIGKTTLASQFPKPIILDTEDGSAHLDVDRVPCRTMADLQGAMHSLVRDPEGYQTVVIDSADWAERMAQEQLLRDEKKDSIEQFGFGKGYVMLAERLSRILALADQLLARGLNVVWVAHAKVVRVSPPDQTDGFDRYEIEDAQAGGPAVQGVVRPAAVSQLPDDRDRGQRRPEQGRRRQGADHALPAGGGMGREEQVRPAGVDAHEHRHAAAAV